MDNNNQQNRKTIVVVDHEEEGVLPIIKEIGELKRNVDRLLISNVFRFVPVIVDPSDSISIQDVYKSIIKTCDGRPDLVLVDQAFGKHGNDEAFETGRDLALELQRLLYPTPIGVYTKYELSQFHRAQLTSDGFAVLLEQLAHWRHGATKPTGDQWSQLFSRIIELAEQRAEQTVIVPKLNTDDYPEEDGSENHLPEADIRTPPHGIETPESELEKESGLAIKLSDECWTWLRQLETLHLAEMSVVGNYVCADPETRGILQQCVDELHAKATQDLVKPYPVLLCAAPGTGKTFFVEEFQRSVSGSNKLIKANLSNASNIEECLNDHYIEILMSDSTVRIAFLDEVDTPIKSETAYRYLLQAMTGAKVVKRHRMSEESLPGVMWFFAASNAVNAESWRDTLKNQVKGEDYLRRFYEAGKVINLPSINSSEEKVVRAASIAKGRKTNLHSIENRAALYLATTRWQDSGELRGAVQNGVDNLRERRVLQLEDLIRKEPLETFLFQYKPQLSELKNRVITIH